MVDKTMTDAVFGEMKWDARLKWWQGRVMIGGMDVIAQVEVEDDEQRAFAGARENLEKLQNNELKFRTKTAKSVLKIYNGAWRQGGKKLKKAELAAELRLLGIVFRVDGGMSLDYDAGEDLFAGHGVMVEIWPNGKMGRADIVG